MEVHAVAILLECTGILLRLVDLLWEQIACHDTTFMLFLLTHTTLL